MTTVSTLLTHIRDDDEQSRAAVGAFVDFLEQSAPWEARTRLPHDGAYLDLGDIEERSTLALARGRRAGTPAQLHWDEAVDSVLPFLREEPDHPSLVFALGESHHPRIRPLLEELTERFFADEARE
jgi:hypothetical protein